MNKNIPDPNFNHKRKYNFHLLKEHGDFIFISESNVRKIRDAAYKYGQYHKIKMITRIWENGVRVYHGGDNA